jgi:hypothetical protein
MQSLWTSMTVCACSSSRLSRAFSACSAARRSTRRLFAQPPAPGCVHAGAPSLTVRSQGRCRMAVGRVERPHTAISGHSSSTPGRPFLWPGFLGCAAHRFGSTMRKSALEPYRIWPRTTSRHVDDLEPCFTRRSKLATVGRGECVGVHGQRAADMKGIE